MPTKKIYTNTLAQIAWKVVTAIISIFLIKLLSVYLGLEWSGIYDKIYNYLSIFAIIADLWLYTISVREMSKYVDNPEKLERISGNILSLRTFTGIGIIFLSIIISLFLPWYGTHEVMGVTIVSIFTLFGLINSSLMSYLQAILKTEFSFIANISGKILTFILILWSIYLWFPESSTALETRLTAVFLAGLWGNILMTLLTYSYCRRFQKIRFYWDKEYIIHILKPALPYGLALFLGAIFFKVDVQLLSTMSPESIANTVTALYSRPMKIIEVGMMYATIFLNSLLPVLTAAIEKQKYQEVTSLSKKWFEILFWFGLMVSLFLSVFAGIVIPFISSHEFSVPFNGYSSVDVLRIVSWIFIAYFISSLANYILIAKNEQKKIIYLNASVALFNAIGNYILIPIYSFMGSAVITLISQILLVICSLYLVRRELRFRDIVYPILSFVSIGGVCIVFSKLLWDILIAMTSHSVFIELMIYGLLFTVPYLLLWFVWRKYRVKSITTL